MRQRFKNGAIAGRRLRHPNIVPVYEYGEDDDCSYIVHGLRGGAGSSPDFVDTVVPQTAIVSYWTGDRYPKDE
jgi:serine/threonine protein kinase